MDCQSADSLLTLSGDGLAHCGTRMGLKYLIEIDGNNRTERIWGGNEGDWLTDNGRVESGSEFNLQSDIGM